MVNKPAFNEPPIEAVVPGVMAPVPEVRVRLPPGEMMSYLDTTVRHQLVSHRGHDDRKWVE